MITRIALMCLFTFNAFSFATAQEKNLSQGYPRPGGHMKQSIPIDFGPLVRSLRNANKRPRIIGGWNVRFDPDYDFAEQRRIYKVIRTLMVYAEEAWSDLVGNLDNDGYSYTFGFGESSKNYSVGQVCEQLIRNTLSASYDDLVVLLVGTGLSTRDLQNPRLRERLELKEWAKSRVQEDLVQLQVATIDELSARFRAFDINEDIKKRFLGSLGRVRARLVRRGIPHLANSFIPHKEQWSYFSKEDANK